MKRILLPFALCCSLALAVSSCRFFPGQQQSQPETEIPAAPESGKPAEPGGIDPDELQEQAESDPMAVLGKILGGLEKLAKKAIDKGWIDTTRVAEEALQDEPVPEPEVSAPAPPPDEWYDHDFALSFTYHQYVGATRSPSNDFSISYTRIGNKVYLHKPGKVAEDSVLDFHDDGTRTFTYYMGGVQVRSNRQEGDIHKYLHYQFTDVGNTFNEILGRHPDISRAQSETTISGRPVAVIHTEKDEQILTQKLHTEKDYYVDKQYGFLYKTVGNGSGGGLTIKNGCPWEVTYFTDKPTQKDIHLKVTKAPK